MTSASHSASPPSSTPIHSHTSRESLELLISAQKRYTNHYFDFLNLSDVATFLDTLAHCTGVIFFTGVGKSGFVAQKIAFTMVSTGTKAFFLSPTDALHGDLGIVSNQDVFIMMSKSGESSELIHLAPAIRNKGASILSVCCTPHSRLASLSDTSITLPFERELCPFDLAPTVSTSSQLLFGDLLTIALMQRKNFSLNEYALNHPSGQIGKRMILRVQDIMLKGTKIPAALPTHTLNEVLVELTNKRCGAVVVMDEKQTLLGLFTDGDLRRALQNKGPDALNVLICDLMNPHPVTIPPDMRVWDAMKQMEQNPHQRLNVVPVTDSTHRVIGFLHIHDLVQLGL